MCGYPSYFAGLLLALCGILPASGARAQVVGVKRPTLMVSDLERSLGVYRDVLGFEVFAISGDRDEPRPASGEERSSAYEYFSIDPGRFHYTRFATLNTRTQTRALGLIELRGAALSQPAPRLSTLVLQVEDVFRTAEQLRALHLKVFSPTRSVTPEGIRFVELPFQDPDGHIIVMYHLERAPVARAQEPRDQSPATPPDPEQVARQAFAALRRGLKTGQWDALLGQLHEDFTFTFPKGTWQGEHRGLDQAREFFSFVSSIYPQGLDVTLDRVTTSGQTVVFEFSDQGTLVLPHTQPRKYENRVVISLDVCGDKICNYREYFGSEGASR